MTFDQWKARAIQALTTVTGWPEAEAAEYVRQSEGGWKVMFDDGLTPHEAADEEYYAMQVSQ